MKRRYFIIAAIFLFNPVVSIFDVFPDFIGYLLIMKAFTNSSYVYDNASETHNAFKQMTIISAAKMASMIILPFTDATMALVFSFSFAIVEVLFGIGAFQRLFNTISFICLRCDEERFVKNSESLKRFTLAFFFARIACSTIPDLFTLFLSAPGKEDLYRFRTLFLILFGVLATVIGTVWLVRFISFFSKTLTADVKEKIDIAFQEEMKDRQTVFFSKDFAFAIGVMAMSMILAIDIYVDNVEFLADVLLAPIFMMAFLFLVKKGHILMQKQEKMLITFLSIHFASSVINTVLLAVFNSKYLLERAYDYRESILLYVPIILFTVTESVFLFLTVLYSLKLMKKYSLERIIQNPKFFSEFSVDGYIEEFKSTLNRKSNLAIIFAAISSVSSVLYAVISPLNQEYVVINCVLAIVFVIMFYFAFSFVNEEVFKKILKYS